MFYVDILALNRIGFCLCRLISGIDLMSASTWGIRIAWLMNSAIVLCEMKTKINYGNSLTNDQARLLRLKGLIRDKSRQ